MSIHPDGQQAEKTTLQQIKEEIWAFAEKANQMAFEPGSWGMNTWKDTMGRSRMQHELQRIVDRIESENAKSFDAGVSSALKAAESYKEYVRGVNEATKDHPPMQPELGVRLYAEQPEITRFEVIDHRAGALTIRPVYLRDAANITYDMQDGGRTLKVFLKDKDSGSQE